ncbi:LytTR family DNA-binding domain-containing protein [Ruminococcus sp. HUN007]|uniref:LytR/AlgR family response regulator transcription factor n=1 Tax=Ruminococcus sp. HUN007 TaxID=1514668 RepID=UPI0005D1B2EF|nr:LytTR family DNA-binding domain-containing protein [Ruminococcus sp. HUN007]
MRFAVCDDEKEICRDISEKIKKIYSDASVTEFLSGEELIKSYNEFEIIFLDIELHGTDGMQVAAKLRDYGCKAVIIFVTAYENRVFEAFDVGAFHFLVKPVSEERLSEIIKKAADISCRSELNSENDKTIIVKSGGTTAKLSLGEIIYAEALDHILILHTLKGKIEYRERIGKFEKQTDRTFFRTHRSYLINLRYLEKYTSSEVIMDNGDSILLSKKRYPELVRSYMNYIKTENKDE